MTTPHRTFRVYLVTDEPSCRRAGHTLLDVVRAATDSHVDAIQIRAKDATSADFLAQVMAVGTLLSDQPVDKRPALIVNDRLDVALVAHRLGAPVSGLHIGQSDLPAAATRELLWPGALLGISATTSEHLHHSQKWVDYFGIGPVFATATKTDAAPALGIVAATNLAAQTSRPCVAIGGIDHQHVAALRSGGFAGVAVASGICAAADPGQAAAEYQQAWTQGSAA